MGWGRAGRRSSYGERAGRDFGDYAFGTSRVLLIRSEVSVDEPGAGDENISEVLSWVTADHADFIAAARCGSRTRIES